LPKCKYKIECIDTVLKVVVTLLMMIPTMNFFSVRISQKIFKSVH